MKTYLYLGTAAAGIMIAGNVYAQCVTTQDCTALGYTETSCPNGKGVKCPFGNKWFCGESSCDYVCEDLGFKYTCSNEHSTGGVGDMCGEKYKSCTCEEGYGWKDGACVKLVCKKKAEDTPFVYATCQQNGGWNPDYVEADMVCHATCREEGGSFDAIMDRGMPLEKCQSLIDDYYIDLGCYDVVAYAVQCKKCVEYGLPD